MSPPRYAVYFTPPPSSAWSTFGSQWLGGDAQRPQRIPAGVTEDRFRALTAAARRYGFHATLKAPFALRAGASEQSLLDAAERLALRLRPVDITPLRVQWLDGFLALMPAEARAPLGALGAACVIHLDELRAPLSAADRERRLQARLDARQVELMERWGYPHVLDRWRFHMTLTDVVERGESSLRAALAAAAWARVPDEPAIVDALSILVERAPGAPFALLGRLPIPRAGRLLYVMGPSGAGKDSLIAWARQRLPADSAIAFARRTIARPQVDRAVDGDEDARTVTLDQWKRMRDDGLFCLEWQANGCAYGIGRDVERQLAAGTSVVVNGSREYLGEALRRFPMLEVIHVTAPETAIRARLAKRGRESESEIRLRVERRIPVHPPSYVPLLNLSNDGALEEAGSKLISALTGG